MYRECAKNLILTTLVSGTINDKLAEKLKDLQEQKRRREADVIMDAYLKSGKSLEEIMTFLKP